MQVQWRYREGTKTSFQPYPKLINSIIEQGYRRHDHFVTFMSQDGKPFLVDLNRMEVVCTCDGDFTNSVKIQRQVVEQG